MTSFSEQAKDMFAVGPDLYSQFHVGVAGAEPMHTAAARYRSTGAELDAHRDQLRATQNAMRESWQGPSAEAAVHALDPIHDALSRASTHAHSSSEVLDDQGAAFTTAQRKITEVPPAPDESPWTSASDITGQAAQVYEQLHQKAAAADGTNQQAYHEYQQASQANQVKQDQARALLTTGPNTDAGGGNQGAGPTPVSGPGATGPVPTTAAGPGAAGPEQTPQHPFAPPALPQSHAVLPPPAAGSTPGRHPYLPADAADAAGTPTATPDPSPPGDGHLSPGTGLNPAASTVASSVDLPSADPAFAGSGYTTGIGATGSSGPGTAGGTGGATGTGGSAGYGAGYAAADGSGAAGSGATGAGPRSGASSGSGPGGSRLSRALAGEGVGEAAGRAGARGPGTGAQGAGMAPGGGAAGGEADKERKSKYGNKKTNRRTNELIGDLPDTAPEVIE